MDLVGEILMGGNRKSHARKKTRDSSEQTDAGDVMLFCLDEKGLDKPFATSTALMRGVDCNGANFGQVRAIKMQRAATDDSAVVFEDNEIADVLANLGQASGPTSF